MSDKITKFLQYLQYEKSMSSHTVLSYRTDLVQCCKFLDISPEEFQPELLTELDIQQWILSMMEGGLSARSISRKISTLKSFWHYLRAEGVVDNNPVKNIILPKTNKPLPMFYKQSEMEEVLKVESDINPDFETERDHLILSLFYQTGLRLSELSNLEDGDVNLETEQLKVIGKRNKERIVPLGQVICKEIKTYQLHRNNMVELQGNWLFVLKNGKKMYNRAIYNIVHRKMSEVSTLKKQSPHVLRHTFATTLINNGADINAVKNLLGHSSLAATQVYTHVSFKEINKIYKQAHPRAIKKGG